jgi:hypothetical protein
MHARALMLSAAAAIALATLATSLPSRAQGALKPVDALIVNPPNRPVPVTVLSVPALTGTTSIRDVDHAARQPFQVSLCRSYGSVNSCGPTPAGFMVSPNRRLVIEYVSGFCPPSGVALRRGETFTALLETTAGGTMASHAMHTIPAVAIGATMTVAGLELNGFGVAQLTRIYADPGSPVTVAIELGGLGDLSIVCRLTLSGHTVSL